MTTISDSGSKVSIVRIVQVLLRESDKDHPLTQQEIMNLMEKKYGMTVNRKSIGRNLSRLREAGLPVKCREVPRMVRGKETSLSLDWYWDHVLSADDLKCLIDLLYFSHLPAQQIKQLAEKLKKLQISTFEDGKGCVRNIPSPGKTVDWDGAVSVISEALREKKRIRFFYDHYEADGKKHHNYTPSGEDKVYDVSPYQLIASDGRYYMLGNQEGSERISSFDLEMMADLEILDAPARLQKELESQAKEEKLSEFLMAYQGVHGGSLETCTFEADRRLMSDILLDFGKAAHVVSASQDKVMVEVVVQPEALKAWTLKKAPAAKILSPAYLVKEVREALQDLARLYGIL